MLPSFYDYTLLEELCYSIFNQYFVTDIIGG